MEELLETFTFHEDMTQVYKQIYEAQATALKNDPDHTAYLSIPVPPGASPEEVVRALDETDVTEAWPALYKNVQLGRCPPIPCLALRLNVKDFESPLWRTLRAAVPLSAFRADANKALLGATILHDCYVELKTQLEDHFQPLFSAIPVQGEPSCIKQSIELFSSQAANGNNLASCQEHARKCIEAARGVFAFISDSSKLLDILVRRFTDIAWWLTKNENNPVFAHTSSAELVMKVSSAFIKGFLWYARLHGAYIGYYKDWERAKRAHDAHSKLDD